MPRPTQSPVPAQHSALHSERSAIRPVLRLAAPKPSGGGSLGEGGTQKVPRANWVPILRVLAYAPAFGVRACLPPLWSVRPLLVRPPVADPWRLSRPASSTISPGNPHSAFRTQKSTKPPIQPALGNSETTHRPARAWLRFQASSLRLVRAIVSSFRPKHRNTDPAISSYIRVNPAMENF